MSNQLIHVNSLTFTADAVSSAVVSATGDGCTNNNVSAGGSCTVIGLSINSDIDETLSSVVVNMGYSYNGGNSTVPLSPIGRILYQSSFTSVSFNSSTVYVSQLLETTLQLITSLS